MKKIWLSSPHMSKEKYEMKYINEAFDTNWIAPLGPNVDHFEQEMVDYLNGGFAIALNSGTSAIHMALKAANITKRDIVLVQSLTFSATVNPIIYEGAVPVFIDSDYKTWNMSPEYLEQALIKYPNAKAVIIVHLYGFSTDIDRIVELCKKYNVKLIEDAAESLGSKYKGKYTGTFGDFGVYSFNGNKIITTSGGGLLISKDFDRIQKVRYWSSQSKDVAKHYQHSELGYNYRMSNISAGIGRGQLKVLNRRIEKKRYIYNYYKKSLNEDDVFDFMPLNEWDEPNYWLSCALVKKEINPIKIIIELEKHNIEARPIWKPMHLQPYFEKYDFIGGGISEDLFTRGICFPSDTKLQDNELEFIVKIIKKAIKDV